MNKYPSLYKYKVIVTILLFIGLGINSSIAQELNSSSLSISKAKWFYVGGYGEDNYSKIQDAVDDANTGDTIFIYDDSSPYNENIIINTTINLFGENKLTTKINGKTKTHTITNNAPNIVISGLTITQQSNTDPYSTYSDYYSEYANIFITNTDNTIVDNILISGKYGIYCLNSSKILIKNMTIFDADYGLYLWKTTNSNIINNSISNCIEAVYGYGCRNCDFFKNTLYDSIEGFYMVNGIQNRYHYNTLYDNNNIGIRADGDIQYNKISNSYYGAFVGKGIFAYNIIENCNLGMESTGLITVKYNTIQNCSFRGLMVAYFFTIVSHNNFFNNSDDASFEQALITRWHSNYWQRPLFRPKIILGYVGFWYISIPLINIDWRPAKEPYTINN